MSRNDNKGRVFLLLFTLLGLFSGIVCRRNGHDEVSLYGESYIQTPFEDANSSTSISLQFRTHRPHGLLLLAAGKTDYVLIQLNAGIVETRVNLGSGEAIVFSARGVRLDDSKWHSIAINRTLDTIFLEIDGIGQGQGTTPGTYYDLNVDIGVILGGKGNLKEDYDRNVKFYRGCLRDVFFNDRNVLSVARDLKSARNAFQVSWYCDDEFFTPTDSPVSLSTDTSFVAFPYLRIYPNQDAIFSCEFKTRSASAILVFNSGEGSTWEDFLAVELVEGKAKLAVDKGSGVIELYVDKRVDDGKWHQMEITISQTVAKLQIDSLQNTTRFHLGGKNVLNLASHVYVGGIGFNARSNAVKLGLAALQDTAAMRGSLMGCIRNIKMNSRSYGFHQVQMSRLIDAGCAWDFPCANDPCIADANCVELEGPDFRCDCDQQVCTKDEYKSVSAERNKDIDGIFSIQELKVSQGKAAAIDYSVIKPSDNILKAVIRESAVVFTIEQYPKYGRIEIMDRPGTFNSFTLQDLKNNKVYYRHGGMKSSELDSTVWKVRFSSLSQEHESKLRDMYEFVIPIHIEQQSSSALKLLLGYGNILSLSSGARIRISTKILDVKDHSVSPSTLIFAVQFLRQAKSRFELASEPGKAITSFSLKDIEDGAVFFQHQGDKIIYTKISVTDGTSESDATDLRFKEENLQISVVNNTGLLLDYGSKESITSLNLSSSPNVKLEDVDIMYYVVHRATHGAVQKFDPTTSQWMNAEVFSQRQVDLGYVRYSHQPAHTIASYDQFKFEVRAKDFKGPPMLFTIRFKSVTLNFDYDTDLLLQGKSYGKFSNSSLMVSSDTVNLNLGNIILTVLRPPRWGSLYLFKEKLTNANDLERKFKLKIDSTFSQQDVNDGFVYYKLDKSSSEELMDYIDLQATYFGFAIMVRARVQYLPQPQQGELVNTGLTSVKEGGYSTITGNMLSIVNGKFSQYTFTIHVLPEHGSINIVEPKTASTLRTNTSYFTQSEIQAGKVVYWHDDSENDKDFFLFSVMPVIDEELTTEDEEIQEFNGKFHILISMRNDNAPIRVINRIFQVAANQSRHLTIKDLSYRDDDIGTDSSTIAYQMSPISNGKLFRADTKEEISNFTQRDLETDSLIFKHSGPSYGRTNLLVSDGQYFSSGLFEIQAMNPFVRIVAKTDLEAKAGQKELLTSKHLSVVSNVDFQNVEVMFHVTEGPQFGHLLLNGGQTSKFTLRDISNNRVQYFNEEENSQRDHFKLSVKLGILTNHSTIYIEIVSNGMNDPPGIVHNQILDVMSFHSAIITNSLLKVTHEDYDDAEIEFIITRLPERGHLTIKGKPVKIGSAPEFTQEDINNGLILFTSDSSQILFDSFMFDVGTEYQSLREVEFLINVLPQRSQRMKINVTVAEGGTFALERDLISISSRLASNKKTRIVVEKPPEYGSIYFQNDIKHSSLSSFSLGSLVQGKIFYGHDDSENYSDGFSLFIKSPDSSIASVSSDILVLVTSINDEPPFVVVNTGLDVWTGSVTLLKTENLQVSDPDSNNEELEIVTSSPTNGHLAYLKNPFRQISRFSQLDVDSGQVVFVHKGAETGEFKFRATDGVNSNELQVFHIRAIPVEIIIEVNQTVEAFPNTLQPILNSSLLARASSSNFTDDIEFTIIKPFSTYGKIISVVNGHSSETKSFTQQDVNKGKIFYKHSGYKRIWEETDLMHLEVSTSYAKTLSNLALVINISYAHINEYNYDTLLNVNPPSVKEGDQITITERNFDPARFLQSIQSVRSDVEVDFSIASLPFHGYLILNHNDADIGALFTRENVLAREMVYIHDHSDYTLDKFQFTVKILVPRSEDEVSLSSAKTFDFLIRIIPVNDMPFNIITVVFEIKVIQGEEVRLTAQNLTTVDLDTGPDGIMYTVVRPAPSGFLSRESAPRIPILHFSQKDINDQKIIFRHNGSREVGGNMGLKVSDGVFQAQFFNMTIAVTPLKITVAPDRGVPYIQGKGSVVIKSEYLKVATTGDHNALSYKVTQAPQFGKLLRHHSRINEFTQKDIDQGLLVYVQDYDSVGDDFFVCDISLNNIDCSLDTVQFDVIMKPLVKQGPLVTAAGSQMAITRASLDASELAQITNDNPRFDITTFPKYGRIMRRNRQKREARVKGNFSPVSNFTFEDIVYTRIYFMARSRAATQDSFSYSLSAKGVPPARGEFIIQLDPAEETTDVDNGTGEWPDEDFDNKETTESTTHEAKKEESERLDEDDEGDVVKEAAVGSNDDDNSIIIAVVVVMLLLVLIIIVILGVCFIRKRRRREASVAHNMSPVKPRPYISGPLQLEQPHVFIEPQQDTNTPVGEEDTALMNDHEDHMYMNTSHVNKSHEGDGDPRQRIPLQRKTADLSLTENLMTPDETPEEDKHSSLTGGRGSNASTDLMEWTLMDPDILQHCYNTTPVLRSNQYWL